MKLILLGSIFTLSIYSLQAQSIAEIKRLAAQGDPVAQFELGSRYSNGEGTIVDKQEAFYWFKRSAEQGNPYAQFNLGTMYYKGEGTPKDLKKAIYWMKRAPRDMVSSSEWLAITFLKFTFWIKDG